MRHQIARLPVPDRLVREIAAEASADIRSVWKRLAGGELRPKVQERIDRALASRLTPESPTP
jgi:hypothetical protein